MKKIIVFIGLILVNQWAWASFYFGTAVATQQLQFTSQLSGYQTSAIDPHKELPVNDHEAKYKLSNHVLFLNAGYRLQLAPRWYLAAEASMGQGNAKKRNVFTTSGNNQFNVQYQTGAQYQFNLVPSYQLTPQLFLQAKFGVVQTSLKSSTNSVDGAGQYGLNQMKEELSGLQYGLGVRYQWSKHFSANLAYQQVTFNSFNKNSVNPTSNPKITYHMQGEFEKITASQILLGVQYSL